MSYAKIIKNPIVAKIENIIKGDKKYIRASRFADIRNRQLLNDVMDRNGYEPHYSNHNLAGYRERSARLSTSHREPDERLGGKTTMQLTIDTLLETGEASSQYLPIQKATLSYNVAELRKKGWVIKTKVFKNKPSVYHLISAPSTGIITGHIADIDDAIRYQDVLEQLKKGNIVDNKSMSDSDKRKLSSAIYRVRAKGFNVETQMLGKGESRHTVYRLI